MTAIDGELVDPETVIICEPGRADAARQQMDRRGEYGGLVYESETCPAGQIIVIDGQKLRENLERSIDEELGRITQHVTNPYFRPWWTFGPNYRMPSRYLIISGQ